MALAKDYGDLPRRLPLLDPAEHLPELRLRGAGQAAVGDVQASDGGPAERGNSSEKEKLENPVEDDKTDDNMPPVLPKPLHI